MAEPSGRYVAFDHTDLERRRKKLWNLAEGVPLTIIGGIDLRALVIAGVVFLGLLGGVMAAAPVLPAIALNLWTILGCLTIAIAIYSLWPRRWRNGLTTEQNLLVAADYLFLQPRRIHGLAADVEPEMVHWRVILWHPVHPRWHRALAEARAGRADRLIRRQSGDTAPPYAGDVPECEAGVGPAGEARGGRIHMEESVA
ncbi:PrgI family protein [Actinopolymorpha alba]|uniref:PrgI family protein n=1 Tax=Actinopolymorpha alba TaxID=533267 RepID=UPI00037F67E4|nr:PrgI family protein [Actinopolymorpha alba]